MIRRRRNLLVAQSGTDMEAFGSRLKPYRPHPINQRCK